MKKEVEELKNDLTCFIKSTETFQNILGSQSKSAEKSGVGFKDPNKNLIKSLVPQKTEMKLKCSYWDRIGHNDSVCYHKKNFIKKNKINSSERSHLNRSESSQKAEKAKKTCFYCNKSDPTRQKVTIMKGSLRRTNPQGPNITWVPKVFVLSNVGPASRCKNKVMVLG